MCSSLTHCWEIWALNRTVIRSIHGFNSRYLLIMTGDDHRVTATAPAYDLVLAVRRRRLCYIGHVLRMPADRMVRFALMPLVIDSSQYPADSLFSVCQSVASPELVAIASNRVNVARHSGVGIVNMRFFLNYFLSRVGELENNTGLVVVNGNARWFICICPRTFVFLRRIVSPKSLQA